MPCWPIVEALIHGDSNLTWSDTPPPLSPREMFSWLQFNTLTAPLQWAFCSQSLQSLTFEGKDDKPKEGRGTHFSAAMDSISLKWENTTLSLRET